MTRLIHLSDLDGDPKLRNSLLGGAVSIGNFDGVHLGHRELLSLVRSHARRVGGKAIAIVMDPHPASVLRPHGAPAALTTLPRRAELMADAGVDFLLVCEATREFLNQTAEQFFQSLIVDRLAAKAMVEGPNFFFGRDRTGNTARLKELCDDVGIEFEIVVPAVREDRMVSSSRIREAIASGEIELANEMLKSVYQIRGRVHAGEGRGRTIGFPTANLVEIEGMPPGHGVYAATVTVESSIDSPRHLAAVHVGPNPTFDDQTETKVEVHLLDYDGDLYGQSLSVQLLRKVRDIRKFDGADALIEQLNADVNFVRMTVSSLHLRTP